MPEIEFEIIETFATLYEKNNGWKKQLSLVSWGGRDPKYDIRYWSPDHSSCKKGLTFTLSELQELKKALNEMVELE